MNSSAHDERWWPSPFGEDDEQGMLNHVTDAKRREALELVREGRLYDLGRILDEQVPVFPGRYFRQTLVTTAHHINADPGQPPPTGLGDNNVNWITAVVTGTMQLGTHIDGLNHLQIGDRGYNGWRVAALAGPAGTKCLGAETIPQIVTRGWLVDVTAVRGVDQLQVGDVITTEDVRRALGGREPGSGDALLFHTGWGRLWTDPVGGRGEQDLGGVRRPRADSHDVTGENLLLTVAPHHHLSDQPARGIGVDSHHLRAGQQRDVRPSEQRAHRDHLGVALGMHKARVTVAGRAPDAGALGAVGLVEHDAAGRVERVVPSDRERVGNLPYPRLVADRRAWVLF